jgi:phospholipid/cholesterol/gamma-HCH transport system permease protein
LKTALTLMGRATLEGLRWLGEAQLLLQQALGFIIRGRIRRAETVQQMAVIGFDSQLIVFLTLLSGGMVLALNTARLLVTWGASEFAGGGVALAVARELGPVLTAVVVAARVGSAIAAELGSMKISDQVDALRSLAVSPVEYLVVPRLVAAIIMLPILTVLADAMGGLGAFLVGVTQGIPAEEYVRSVQRFLTSYDLFGGLAKAAVFGFIIGLVACHTGLRARGGAVGVGRATTSAVVISIVLIYLSDYFLSWIMLSLLALTGR